MINQLNGDGIISDLLRAFNQDNIVLFAGTEVIRNGELTKKICDLPWSCVITTCKEDDFGLKFYNNGRQTKEYTPTDEIPLNLFNRNNLPIIYLFGKESTVQNELEDEDESFRVNFAKNQAEKILNRIMSKIDIRSRMVVVGYNANNGSDIAEDKFIFSWEELQGGTIEFFYSAPEPSKSLKNHAQKRNYIWYEGKIADLVEDVDEEYDYEKSLSTDETNLFYKGKEPVTIKSSTLSRYYTFLQLLTEERINRIRPLGIIQQSKWFYNFLNNSSDVPQWYGFLPQSEFYLKRNYEDAFFATVRNLLSSKNLSKKGKNTPVILEGDSVCSKSIELAALAYRIFNEKIHPVIFINVNSFHFASRSNEFLMLDELMQEIEALGEKDTRFLIVWDSSYYKDVIAEANQLANALENRGRRFVLVCSAYRNSLTEEEKNNRQDFKFNSVNQRIEKTDIDGDIYYLNNSNCYFVHADRHLEKNELEDLKQKVIRYSMVDSIQIEKIWNEISLNNDSEISNDVLTYFYRLINLIRPKIEAGLSREQRFIDRYVRQQIALFEKRQEEDNYSPLKEQLIKLGFTLNNDNLKLIVEKEAEEEKEYNSRYDLKKFGICIAMFSRFKLDVSYTLAWRMICKNKEDFFGRNQIYNNQKLFNILTYQIPYIHYVQVPDDKFVFRFRSTLEAEIHLTNNQVSAENQIDIVIQIINYYIENYKYNREVDIELKETIQTIIRMFGPNTDYPDFWKGGKYEFQHLSILREIHKIADKLYEVRTKYQIPDEDCGLAIIEVTLYREIYGKLWAKLHNCLPYQREKPWKDYPEFYTKETYEKRLCKLSRALNLAQESLEKLESSENANLNTPAINNMTVELVAINGVIESINKEYEIFANEHNIKGNGIHLVNTLNYSFLYPRLFDAIQKDELNGYLYNALFKLFKEEYKKADEERKLSLLSDVRMIAEEASTLEISNRGSNGSDELTPLLSDIVQYSSRYKVYISDITNSTAPDAFKKLFKNLLARNNASGICFVCQQELDAAKLNGQSIADYEKRNNREFVLTQAQLNVCKKIVDFIKNPKYETCIEKSTQALFLLFRVEWMLYNKRPYSIVNEWQKTYLSVGDWVKIHDTCERYENISTSAVRPIVTLIYALAKIHINKDYINATKIMYKLAFMQNKRMRVPYLICFEPGVAYKYSGTVISTNSNNYSGFIRVNGLPYFSEKNQGVKFYIKNLRMRRMPIKNAILKDFELGLMLTGKYSAHKSDDGGELHG